MSKTKSNLNKEHESFATFKRIVRYDEMIASGTYPNVEDFRREFKVSEATVHRDLDALRWQFGAEFLLEYDRCKKGYYYTRSTFRVPGHLSTAKQIVAAHLMQNLIETLHGTPLYNQAVEVFANFSDNIEPDSQISLGKELSKKISFIGMEPAPISNEVWDSIETALAKNQYITFDYRFYDGNKHTQKYTIEPWQLLYYQGMWSLYGNVPKEKAVKFFNLPLISNVEVRKETFEPPKDWEYLKKAKGNFGRYIGSETFKFKIRINRDITANYIKTYKWTDDQKF
ncbi:MAG: WYL domain-containing protein, partial [Methanobrevibacter sp.]|nr:WYL domain-containing protein [Methanobrevibacter sp.]